MSVNKVILLGNVGKKPEIRQTQSGQEIANFSLATSESWKDKSTGEKKEKTEWHDIVVFSQPIVNLIKNYIDKGAKLYIEGSIETTKYTKDNIEKYKTQIVIKSYNHSIQILNSNNANQYNQESDDSDDIDF